MNGLGIGEAFELAAYDADEEARRHPSRVMFADGSTLSLPVLLARHGGRLLGDAFWAGGLIVGVVLLIAAAMAGRSAASDARSSEALRLEKTRRTVRRDTEVLADELRETKEFAQREAREFKQHATGGATTEHRH